jgi:hypothetical protein
MGENKPTGAQAPAAARQAPRCMSIAHVLGLCRGCGRSSSVIHIVVRRAYCPACCPVCNPRPPLAGEGGADAA